MNTTKLVILIAFVLGIVSCKPKDDSWHPRRENIHMEVQDEMSDKEIIYHNQTNKNNILGSLIRYDYSKNMYILDISKEDAISLGITSDEFEQAKRSVEQMNKVSNKPLKAH